MSTEKHVRFADGIRAVTTPQQMLETIYPNSAAAMLEDLKVYDPNTFNDKFYAYLLKAAEENKLALVILQVENAILLRRELNISVTSKKKNMKKIRRKIIISKLLNKSN